VIEPQLAEESATSASYNGGLVYSGCVGLTDLVCQDGTLGTQDNERPAQGGARAV